MAAQHFGKQVVVAVPMPLLVQGDHKQVGPLERFQHGLTSLLFPHCIAEWSAEAFEETGVQEKLLHRGGLPREHLCGEVVEHIAMAPSESNKKPGDISPALQRKRSQLQAGNPAFR